MRVGEKLARRKARVNSASPDALDPPFSPRHSGPAVCLRGCSKSLCFVVRRCLRQRQPLSSLLCAILLGALCFTAFFLQSTPQQARHRSSTAPVRSVQPNQGNPPRPVQPVSRERLRLSLVVPLVAPHDSQVAEPAEPDNTTALQQLFGPLFAQEGALCEGSAAAGVRGVEAVVVSDAVGASVVQRAVASLLVSEAAVEGIAVREDDGEDGLTAGDAWRVWEVQTSAARAAASAASGGALFRAAPDGSTAGCLGERVTVVAALAGGRASSDVGGVERLVDAGLRTRGGRAGSHFVVVSSFVGATRMAHTVPGDAAEARREGRGLLAALVATATQRNGGRVAAAQCTLLQRRGDAPALAGGVGLAWPPAALGAAELGALEVVDKGALTGSTHNRGMLQPYVARRLSGYGAEDQRASWEDVVDAASLHCGIFARGVYDGVGGLAGALAGGAVRDAVSARPEHAMGSCDRGGWALTLRMQAVYPAWQVWCSRAAAVVRDDLVGVRGLAAVASLQRASFSLLDAYGVSVYDVVTALQRRRVGVSWRNRSEMLTRQPPTGLTWTHMPPVIRYMAPFRLFCSGVSREAMGYIRPLMERYAIRVPGRYRFCPKAESALLALAYNRGLKNLWFQRRNAAAVAFFTSRYKERARVNFQHVFADELPELPPRSRTDPPVAYIARSLSELSNVQRSWVEPMKTRVDEMWATADSFATIYKRNGLGADRIRVVPEAVDVYELDPARFLRKSTFDIAHAEGSTENRANLTDVERLQRYVFFSNFKWEDRKGWDVLLKAYWAAFGPSAPPELQNRTTLVIKTQFLNGFSGGAGGSTLVPFFALWARLGNLPGLTSYDELPHIIFATGEVEDDEMAQLYANADAFVYPTRAEGWGLPAVEAMSMGLPVLVTEWSGQLGFMAPNTCFRIPVDGLVEIPKDSPYGYAEGMKYAVPSWEKTAELMRYVVQHPEHARRVGRRAREYAVRELSEEAVADLMDRELLDALRKRTPAG